MDQLWRVEGFMEWLKIVDLLPCCFEDGEGWKSEQLGLLSSKILAIEKSHGEVVSLGLQIGISLAIGANDGGVGVVNSLGILLADPADAVVVLGESTLIGGHFGFTGVGGHSDARHVPIVPTFPLDYGILLPLSVFEFMALLHA